jgi:hypothetical protein
MPTRYVMPHPTTSPTRWRSRCALTAGNGSPLPDGRKRKHDTGEFMARIVAQRLVDYLGRSGFVSIRNRQDAAPKMTMRRALTDLALLGKALEGDSWQAWRVLLVAMTGETLINDEREVFKRLTGRNSEPLERVEEFCGALAAEAGRAARRPRWPSIWPASSTTPKCCRRNQEDQRSREGEEKLRRGVTAIGSSFVLLSRQMGGQGAAAVPNN